jgi:hypothetical protein
VQYFLANLIERCGRVAKLHKEDQENVIEPQHILNAISHNTDLKIFYGSTLFPYSPVNVSGNDTFW